jgi:hypothetical protein
MKIALGREVNPFNSVVTFRHETRISHVQNSNQEQKAHKKDSLEACKLSSPAKNLENFIFP